MTSAGQSIGIAVHQHALGWHLDDWSDFNLTFRISGRMIVKKRSLKVIRMGERYSVGHSTEFRHWEKRAAAEIAAQWQSIFPHGAAYPLQSETRFNLQVVTWFENRVGIPDLCATFDTVQDVLEAHKSTCKADCKKHGGVIVNDKLICSYHPDCDRLLDPEDPHTDIVLRPHRPTANP